VHTLNVLILKMVIKMRNKEQLKTDIPKMLKRRGFKDIAYHFTSGRLPTVAFLGGLMSDMTGTKAMALETHCKKIGQAFIRFDYTGHGQSGGNFIDYTISDWQNDTLAIIDRVIDGPIVLVGSSMGGWQMLLAVKNRPTRINGLIGVAVAPDFTEDLMWGKFPKSVQELISKEGIINVPSHYEGKGYPITLKLIEDGRKNLLLRDKINFSGPVRLLHGMCDEDVPWQTTLKVVDHLSSMDVVTTFIKDGDHRLSNKMAIQKLRDNVDEICLLVQKAKNLV